MNYKINPKDRGKLSILGSDYMRFGGDSLTSSFAGSFDTKRAEWLIKSAIDSGVNYFNTTYAYNGDEGVFSRTLAKCGIRNKAYITTGMPLILRKSRSDSDKYFAKHLERLQMDYIDYYLLHMLVGIKTWNTLCGWGIKEWVAEEKASGQAKQFGFSSYGAQGELVILLDAYGWDFCQIQYNYPDENHQTGVKELKKAAIKGIPVMVTEPLLGGKLVGSLPEAAVELLGAIRFRTKFFIRKK